MIIIKPSQNERLNAKAHIKAAMLLTIGVFLISAPAPDANFISDITANLIVNAESPSAEARYGQDSNT